MIGVASAFEHLFTPGRQNGQQALMREAVEHAAGSLTTTPMVATSEPAAPPLTFREFIQKVSPKYKFYRHCEVKIAVLQRVADDELSRVMIFEPPRHGKSETTTRLFPAYYLYRHPERWTGITSYADNLAYGFSRAARRNYLEGEGVLADDAAAVSLWETDEGGGLWAAGAGGSATGKGFHLGIIDDPYKDAKEANSTTVRANRLEWLQSVFFTREEPGGAIIIQLTRWSEAEDDIVNTLLDQEGGEEPEHWHIVCFEAIKLEDPPEYPKTCTVEPDWRETGEALCPERYPVAKLRKLRARIREYYWNALYQQRPKAREGSMFKRSWFQVVDAVPKHNSLYVRAWDHAASHDSGDWTVGLKMQMHGDTFYILDIVRGQWLSGSRDGRIRETTEMDGHGVPQWREQEPGASGKDAVDAFVRLLKGFTARSRPASGDKVLRAEPLAAYAECEQKEEGKVKLLRGDWNATFLDEITGFPTGKHDDQVDAASLAFSVLASKGTISLDIAEDAFAGLTQENPWGVN